MPVSRRGTRSVLTSARRVGRPALAPPPARPPAPRAAPEPVAGARSSTSVFHSWQPGHCPCQRTLECPHCEQTWTVVGRAMYQP